MRIANTTLRRWCQSTVLLALCLAGIGVSRTASAQTKPPTAATQGSTPAGLDGAWAGTLKDGAENLRLRLVVKSNDKHESQITLYSLDQGNQPIPCRNVKREGVSLSFDVPAVKGHWTGIISADAKTLTGTWTQDSHLPLAFAREVK